MDLGQPLGVGDQLGLQPSQGYAGRFQERTRDALTLARQCQEQVLGLDRLLTALLRRLRGILKGFLSFLGKSIQTHVQLFSFPDGLDFNHARTA